MQTTMMSEAIELLAGDVRDVACAMALAMYTDADGRVLVRPHPAWISVFTLASYQIVNTRSHLLAAEQLDELGLHSVAEKFRELFENLVMAEGANEVKH